MALLYKNFCAFLAVFTVAILMAANPALAAEPLPEVDQRAVWKGDPFIDATIAWLKKEHPNLKLKADIKNFKVQSDTFYDRADRHKRRNPGKKYIPGASQTFDLLNLLHSGHKIKNVGGVSDVKHWLLQQPDRSVLPHELLGRAIFQTGGDTLRGLSLVWNLLSEGWYAAGTRNASPVAIKLFDVTGEFDLRDGPGHFVVNGSAGKNTPLKDRIKFLVTKRGDVFSTYYHYFGAMLFSHYLAAKSGQELTGRMASTMAVKFEAALHRQTSGLDRERQKRILNDIEGANAGARLKSAVTHPERFLAEGKEKPTYLVPHPKLKERYLLEADGRSPVHYGMKADAKFSGPDMSPEELKLRFDYAVNVNHEIFDPVILATSSDGERLQVGLQKYIRAGATDPELNALVQKFHSGWKGSAASSVESPDFSLDVAENSQHLGWESGRFDLSETRRRVDKLMQLLMETKQLPLLPPPAAKPAKEGLCSRLFWSVVQ